MGTIAPADPVPPLPVPVPAPVQPNWINPAFLLTLVPQVSAILVLFFHKDFGLSANSSSFALLASAIVAVAAYVSRAVKHHQAGAIWQAYLNLIASGNVPVPVQFGGDGRTVPNLHAAMLYNTARAASRPVTPHVKPSVSRKRRPNTTV